MAFCTMFKYDVMYYILVLAKLQRVFVSPAKCFLKICPCDARGFGTRFNFNLNPTIKINNIKAKIPVPMTLMGFDS